MSRCYPPALNVLTGLRGGCAKIDTPLGIALRKTRKWKTKHGVESGPLGSVSQPAAPASKLPCVERIEFVSEEIERGSERVSGAATRSMALVLHGPLPPLFPNWAHMSICAQSREKQEAAGQTLNFTQ